MKNVNLTSDEETGEVRKDDDDERDSEDRAFGNCRDPACGTELVDMFTNDAAAARDDEAGVSDDLENRFYSPFGTFLY